ncbi:MAG: hypothetical protein RRY29_08305 [Desulfovibrionaceae bacterium]
MNWPNILWWICFIPLAFVVQIYVPGLDALVIGLVIVLQERRYKDLLWVLPLLVILQEGMGSREFGGAIVWYMMVIIVFNMGRWLFEVENILFICLLAGCLGASHFAIVYFMAPLQNLPVDIQNLTDESLTQAIFIATVWWLAYFSRRGVQADEENA